MCVVSMIGDHYGDKYREAPFWIPQKESEGSGNWPWVIPMPAPISREEFDALKRDVEEMKALLKRAKSYDERNGEPDCEIDEKMDLLRKLAAVVGVDLEDVIGPQATQ